MPANPGAWLTAAHNRARDRLRRESVRPGRELAAVIDDITARTDRAGCRTACATTSLRMMFTCAHPALERAPVGADPAAGLGLTWPRSRRRFAANEAPPSGSPAPRPDQACQHPVGAPVELLPERTARAVVHLLGVHRGLLVHRRTVGDPRPPVRRRGAASGEITPGCLANWRRRRWQSACAACMIRQPVHPRRQPGSLVPLEEQDRRRWDRGRSAAALEYLRRANGSADRTCRRP